MPHISKHRISEVAEKALKRRFVEIIRAIGRDRRSKYAIRELFTDTECLMLGKRLAIIYMLSKENSILDICETLNVSSSTVIRIGRVYDRCGYENLEKIFHKLEPSLLEVLEIIMSAGVPLVSDGRFKKLSEE